MILKNITNVSNKINKTSKLSVKSEDADLKKVMNYLKIDNPISAMLFCYITCVWINNEYIYYTLSEDFDLQYSNIEILCFVKDFEVLFKKGYFIPRGKSNYMDDTFDLDYSFIISEELISMLTYDKPIDEYKPKYTKFSYDFITFISSLKDLPNKVIKNTHRFSIYVKKFYDESQEVREMFDSVGVNHMENNIPETGRNFYKFVAVCYLIKQSLQQNGERALLKAALTGFGYSNGEIVDFFTEIKNGENAEFNSGYLKLSDVESLENLDYELGDKLINNFGDKLYLLEIKPRDLKSLKKIETEKIVKKELFYNPKNIKDIKRLKNILKEENYKSLMDRLAEKGYNKGLTVALFGPPGTGKTETVLQMAKETGRDIIQLDLSSVRSCWVGESEKNIKAVFDSYKKITTKLKPILLFNEADGILTKRTDGVGNNSGVEKMENTMQNIILEELEKFEGIFIATTNLVGNFDKALERRFLYKLELCNPDLESREKIIKNQIPDVDDDIIKEMSKFELSGGQINNISKKIEIDYILYGNKPTKDNVIDFCNKEKFDNDAKKVMGFHV